MKTNKVVVDTNVLIYAVQDKRDLFEELQKFLGSFEVIVLDRVMAELEGKSKSKTAKLSTRTNAKIALNLVDEKMKVVGTAAGKLATDDLILNYAKKNDAYIYTNDKNMKKRAKERKIKIVEP